MEHKLWGDYIKSCKVTKISGSGSYELEIHEGTNTVFDSDMVETNDSISYEKKTKSFMTTKTFRPFFLAAFAASLAFTVSLRAAIPPAENLLPSDTLFVVTVPDCTAMRSVMHESPQWMLWGDPAMKPFHDKFMAKLNDSFVAPLEKDLGVKLADFADLPQGQFTFAVMQNGWSGTRDPLPSLVLLVDAKDKSDSLKTTIATLQKKWTDSGKKIRTEDVRGIKFSVVPLSTNDVPAFLAGMFGNQRGSELGRTPAPVKSHEIVIGQFESLLIVGTSIKVVEPVAAHLTGGSAPALNDNAIFAADKAAHPRRAGLLWLVQREGAIHRAFADSRAAAESRRAQPDAAIFLEQDARRRRFDGFEKREFRRARIA